MNIQDDHDKPWHGLQAAHWNAMLAGEYVNNRDRWNNINEITEQVWAMSRGLA